MYLAMDHKIDTYRILLNPEPEGGYTVTVPALSGCVTYGETIEEALSMAKEAIAGMKLSMQDLSAVMSDSEDYTPVISPVLDASQALSQFDAV